VSGVESTLLPSGAEVPFAKIASALARGDDEAGRPTAMRALMATVVAVGPVDRLAAAADVLQSLDDAGVRGIVISEGSNPAPPARVSGNTIALADLKESYVNNAVAALRLSSLPTLVWWRGGRPETLDALADLADRVVLDEEQPDQIWARAVKLFDESAFSDLRWARLTKWRALMAQFFDIPEVRASFAQFTRLRIATGDRISAELFAAWLTSSVTFTSGLQVELCDAEAPIEEIRLGHDGNGNDGQQLVLRLAGSRPCVEAAAVVSNHASVSQIVPLGDESLRSLLMDELRIRARDAAFERTLRARVGA
jgi:glucose-6-phosphate dehydrogenase assembly protein OpcA